MKMCEEVDAVLTNLTTLIYEALREQASESLHPGGDPDRSDDVIKAAGDRADTLRRLRAEFEDAMTSY